MEEIVTILSTREWAIAIWGTGFFVWMLTQREIRKSLWNVIKILLGKNLRHFFLIIALYVAGITLIFYQLPFWNNIYLKDIILWLIFSGISYCVNSIIKGDAEHLKSTVKDNFRVIVIFEYFIGTFTFKFWIEMLIIPVITILILMNVVAESEEKYRRVHKLIDIVLACIGWYMLWGAANVGLKEYKELNAINTLVSFMIPIVYTILILPLEFGLEGEFAEMNGWEAESDAATLLNGLGIEPDLHYTLMGDLNGNEKVKVLLARALFGNPDILLLDEPTNHLDLGAIEWLEEFLINFENTVIVVSHDRYFLNKVCTHTADIDYGKIQLYAGNYDFWYESSQLMIRQMKEANKKKEEKIKELQDFISRFSANASKSKQATSRKRALEKIQLDEIRPSSRKYPYIDFRPEREIGNEVLMVENLSKTIDGVKVLDDISFTLGRNDKVAFVGGNELAKTVFFKILMGEMEPDEGSFKWGVTTSQAYFPKDSTKEFDNDLTIVDWLTQFSEIKDATYVRGFLGRMLFAGDDGVKQVRVLSGGEKVRCLLSKMMISGANILIFDEPTNHLDMESITALNNGMIKFPGVILFASHDHQIVQTTANRIMEILPNGKLIDKITSYDEYLASDEMAKKRQVYSTEGTLEDN